MKLLGLLSAALLAVLLWIAGEQSAGARDGVVRFYLFYGETCPHCHEVMDNYLPKVYEKYGERVEYQYFEVFGNPENYRTMLGLERKMGLSEDLQGMVPALVVGDKILVGGQEIPDMLERFIDEYLAQGGVEYPSLENLPEVLLPTPAPTAQILVFFDRQHRDFTALNDLIVALGQKYGSQLRAAGSDLTDSVNAERLAGLNKALGAPQPAGGTPEVLVGWQLLVGLTEIEGKLPGLIEGYLAQGGVQIPPWEQLLSGKPADASTPSTGGTPPVRKPIYVAYFEKAGCQECARTTYDLKLIQSQYPQLVVDSFPMEESKNKALNEWLAAKYGVPEEKRLSSPMIFVGKDVLVGKEVTLNGLLAAVGKYVQSGAERTWEGFDAAQAEQSLVNRFKSFGVLTVAGAGLIDGLNPCAFATLVFFISYLAFTGRRGRDILLVGTAFTVGVFLTYLLVGVGLLKVVQSLGFFTALGRWVYLVTALLCMALAALTFRDYSKARQGQMSDMTLRLPMRLRRQIHKVIRESSQLRAFVGVAFATGFVVSLLELACTGQVYLPTIMFVLSVPSLAAQAFLYLLLYCVMFILPLVIVFAVTYFGTTSEQLGRVVNRHTATIKAATGLLFLGLALWMTWTVAPLFEVTVPWNWVMMAGVLVVTGLAVVLFRATENRASQKTSPKRRRSRA